MIINVRFFDCFGSAQFVEKFNVNSINDLLQQIEDYCDKSGNEYIYECWIEQKQEPEHTTPYCKYLLPEGDCRVSNIMCDDCQSARIQQLTDEFNDLGEWIKVDPTRKKANKWRCSLCGGICYGSSWWEYNQYKYCPNCGRKMLT